MKNFKIKLLVVCLLIFMGSTYLIGKQDIFLKSNISSVPAPIPFQLLENGEEKIAIKINGKSLPKNLIDFQFDLITTNYKNYFGESIDVEILKTYIFNDFIDRILIVEIAKNLNLSISKSDLDNILLPLIEGIGNENDFIEIISKQGYTPQSFNFNIVQTLSKDKVLNHLKSTMPEKEIESYLQHLLNIARKHIKITDLAPEYTEYLEKVVDEKNGFQITNLDIAQLAVQLIPIYNGNFNLIQLEVQNKLNEKTFIGKLAREKDIEIDETLPFLTQLDVYSSKLLEKFRDSIVPSQEELKIYFVENSLKYDKFPTATAEISAVKIDPENLEDISLKKETLSKLANSIKNREIIFKDLQQIDKNIVFNQLIHNIGNSGYIPEIGDAPKLSKKIFNSNINSPDIVLENEYIYLFNKISETPYMEAKFEEVETLVLQDYRNEKGNELFEELLNKKEDIL